MNRVSVSGLGVSAEFQGCAVTAGHRFVGDRDAGRCVDCGVTVWRRVAARHDPGPSVYLQWLAPDGRDWSSFPEGEGWVTYPDDAPTCPPQDVEAACPWEEDARRYGGVWGDVQLETALRTWCARHEMAVADCPEPGPHCPGWPAHEDGEPGMPGPCTGREDTCGCMCPACLGETAQDYGFDGDY